MRWDRKGSGLTRSDDPLQQTNVSVVIFKRGGGGGVELMTVTSHHDLLSAADW